MPEALAVDHYVQTGVGNPAKLLSDLRFWTWNTVEVMAMIEWMRAWNAAGHQPRVHFSGFDMGYAGVAIDSVTAYTARVDPGAGASVAGAYSCLNQLRNPPNSYFVDFTRYAALSAESKAACRQGIQGVDSLFARSVAAWSSAEGAGKNRVMRRLARIVDQWEVMSSAPADQGFYVRDQFMAENVGWWHDTQAPGSKMVLWAHNGHISRVSRLMGDHLSRKYGAAYIPVGQTFGTGSFNAIFLSDANQLLNNRVHTVTGFREEAIERIFTSIGVDRLIFDARRLRSASGPAIEPLGLPLTMRSVGASFQPSSGVNGYQVPLQLRSDYDLIIWFSNATASRLLPFIP